MSSPNRRPLMSRNHSSVSGSTSFSVMKRLMLGAGRSALTPPTSVAGMLDTTGDALATRISITCGRGGAGLDTGGRTGVFVSCMMLPARRLKSTRTSTRAPGGLMRLVSGTGRGRVPAPGDDLAHARAGDVEVEDARVASVQDPEAVQARLDLEVRPDLAVDEHHVAEVLADPGRVVEVADRVEEPPVVVELPVLDDERHLVLAVGQAVRIAGPAGVELVPEDVGAGEAGEDVQARRPEAVIVEPVERGGHLGVLVRGFE